MKDRKLTPNFSLAEMCHSDTADKYRIANEPSEEVVHNLERLCVNILQPLRNYINRPVRIHCGYRNAEVNEKVGGVPTSQHTKGEAADFDILPLSSTTVADKVDLLNLDYDQMIVYPTFVHISFTDKRKNRHQRIKK